MNALFCVLALLALASLSFAMPVTQIPGYKGPKIEFDMKAGVIEANKDHGRELFYFYASPDPTAAEFKASQDDNLIVWFNGGPGCSSLLGAFTEYLGPFVIQKDGSVTKSQYSWNKFAHFLAVESPAGVGYSYSEHPEDYKNCNDNRTATDVYQFLQNFLDENPTLRQKNLYVGGESYGGHYVPRISMTIHEMNQRASSDRKINFKGMLVGNGCTDLVTDTNSLPTFLWQHSVIPESLYVEGIEKCKGDFYKHQQEAQCESAMDKMYQQITDINIYDLYGYCEHSNNGPMKALMEAKMAPKKLNGKRLHPLTTVAGSLGSNGGVPCFDFTYLENYFNSDEVRRALNVPSKSMRWSPCSNEINRYYDWTYVDMLFVYQAFLNKYKVLVYTGDVDAAVNTMGTQEAIQQLNTTIVSTWKNWYYGNDRQVGGKKRTYMGNLFYYSIRGAGHMVPQMQPEPGFKLFSGFINDQLP